MASVRLLAPCFVTAILLSAWGCKRNAARPDDPESAALRTAITAVDQFHKDLGSGKAADICRNADPKAFKGVTEMSCPEFLQYLHEKLGAFVEARRPQMPLVATGPVRVGMEYMSRYDRAEAREHFEYLVHGGQAILTSYRLQSDAITKSSAAPPR